MKHVVLKGEKNEEELSKHEMVSVIQAAANFVIAQLGHKPSIEDRKSFAATIVKLFPKLKANEVFKKLDQRLKNVLRTTKVKKIYNGVEAERNADMNAPDGNCSEESNTDYDVLVEPQIVFASRNIDDMIEFDEDYLEDESKDDKNESENSEVDE